VLGDGRRSPRLWVDVATSLPELRSKPFLVESARLAAVERVVTELGFQRVHATLPTAAVNPEDSLLVELSAQLNFSMLGAGSWAAYSDRLWDLQMSDEETPIAIFVSGLDGLLPGDLHSFVRCVHNLLSMTEAVGLADDRADRQLEYFFVGAWTRVQRAGRE
jgi:hypothetical protein